MKAERILYIDGWNVILATNAISLGTDANGNADGCYLGTLSQIRQFIDKFKPQKVFFVLDGPEAGERRRGLYPNYKGKRRITNRESKVQIMEGDDNMVYGSEGEFQNQLIKIYEFLRLLPVSVIMVPFCEADDMISYMALKNKDKFANIIVSNDKDYLQLIQENIYVYRWKAKKLYDTSLFSEEFKIRAEHYIFKKVLLGDAGDMVPGIKGIGEKTFLELSFELMRDDNTFKTVDEFISHFEKLDLSSYSTRTRNAVAKAFANNKDKMGLLYSIMKLDESCMLPDHADMLSEQIDEQVNKGFSRLSAKMRMMKDNFGKLYKGFNDDSWLQTFAFLRPGIQVNK